MPSQAFELFRTAIREKQQVVCRYRGHVREVCPHVVGHGIGGSEKVLTFQFAGGSSTGLPPQGEWRCLEVAEVTDVQLRDGTWRTADNHSRPQTCVKSIVEEVAL